MSERAPAGISGLSGTAGIVGLLLAAGKGSRFDASGRESKLLAPLADGTPVALASARRLLECCPRVLAVLPQHAAPPRDQHIARLVGLLAEAGCEIVFCADSDAGLGHSLAAGVRAAPDAGGWLVALADMPAIKASTLRAVSAACAQAHSIAAPVYQGGRGHPVAFGSAYYAQLAALHGDNGARGILRGHASAVIEVPCDDAGIVRDIDTPEDLANLAGEFS
ncbi:nucleotidyltransferase family protein [Oxalobacteraceae bacterium CAVE-383]|nr:nucleotidyltransferase family protein [Oxalobacteraceae bacterium CAVE-383]